MSGSCALVTGASTGIGEAFARRLASDGRGLVLVARNQERLNELAEQLRRAHGVEVEVLPADLGDEAGLAKVRQRLEDSAVPVELLVNNAGYTTYGGFTDLPIDGEVGQVHLHVRAAVQLTHTAARNMRSRRRGGVINVSSAASFQPGPGLATYTATKAFLMSFSESLHEELRTEGVTVTCVCPGYTRTELQQRAHVDMSHLPGLMWQSAEHVARVGLAGHARGRALVVPGAVNRAMAVASRFTPRPVSRRLAALLLQRRDG